MSCEKASNLFKLGNLKRLYLAKNSNKKLIMATPTKESTHFQNLKYDDEKKSLQCNASNSSNL